MRTHKYVRTVRIFSTEPSERILDPGYATAFAQQHAPVGLKHTDIVPVAAHGGELSADGNTGKRDTHVKKSTPEKRESRLGLVKSHSD
jgi:hypothetical protein